jgi:hypothetical protein
MGVNIENLVDLMDMRVFICSKVFRPGTSSLIDGVT